MFSTAQRTVSAKLANRDSKVVFNELYLGCLRVCSAIVNTEHRWFVVSAHPVVAISAGSHERVLDYIVGPRLKSNLRTQFSGPSTTNKYEGRLRVVRVPWSVVGRAAAGVSSYSSI